MYNTQQLEVEVKVAARSNLQHVAVSTWDKEAAFACVAIREFDQHDKSLNPAREPVSRELMRQAAPPPPANVIGGGGGKGVCAQCNAEFSAAEMVGMTFCDDCGAPFRQRRPNEFRRRRNVGHHPRGGAVPGMCYALYLTF